jgi:hypothetical protein
MWMAAQDQPHENYFPRGGTTTWKRFDDLEITTNKTIESTDLHGGLEMLV